MNSCLFAGLKASTAPEGAPESLTSTDDFDRATSTQLPPSALAPAPTVLAC